MSLLVKIKMLREAVKQESMDMPILSGRFLHSYTVISVGSLNGHYHLIQVLPSL